jgi:glucokinase
VILAGDIGGTKSNLALMEKNGDGFRLVFIHRYPNHEFTRFDDIVEDFLARGKNVLAA